MEPETRFVDDIFIQGTYFAVLIRSPIAHGRLKAIESPDMPNSYTLITAHDIVGQNRLADVPVPILAFDALSYIGEPVAILTGFDLRKLEEYAALCTVLCEEAMPVFSSGDIPASSILTERHISTGEAPSGALTTVSGVYKTGIQEHWYAEPHGAVAIPARDQLIYDHHPEEKNPRNLMVIHTATGWSDHVTRSVSLMLDIPTDALLVEPTVMGLHLDGKTWYPSLLACQAALAAQLIHRPVKLMLTREEDFRYSPKRNATDIAITGSFDEQGEVAAIELTVRADLGAQRFFTDAILDSICGGCQGAYAWPRLTLNGLAFSTNLPPQGPFAGFGLAQGFFAIERYVSVVADSLRRDPAQWRKDHLRGDDAPLAELIDRVAATADYYRKWASYELLRQKRQGTPLLVKDEALRGIGLTVAYQEAARDDGAGSPARRSWVAAVVEVAIDQIAYTPNIRGIWLVVEAGGVVSEEQTRFSLKTAVIHALGWAAWEKLSYERGKIPSSYLFSYDIPPLTELPPIHIEVVKRETDAKACAELPFNSVPAAYLQAVSQAMDHRFEKIPLSAVDVWAVEKARQQEYQP
jgi:CO/xanthine dehydrogenase Mo-binding subunit